MNILIGYPKCTTCKKSEKYLCDNNIKYEYRNIKENKLNIEELKDIIDKSKKDIQAFFNTSGLVYRSLNLKDKLQHMDREEKIKLLASDGMLVKRPILIYKDKILVGFKEKEYDKLIK